jgi:hypothetical protein
MRGRRAEEADPFPFQVGYRVDPGILADDDPFRIRVDQRNPDRDPGDALRIDSLSAGISFPCCSAKGASLPSVENCRRRGSLYPHVGLITITGIDDHLRQESVITFHWIG